MFFQFNDKIFRRNFESHMNKDVLYDREGDLILLVTNKAKVIPRLKLFFETLPDYDYDGQIGVMHKFSVDPKSRLVAEHLSKKGEETSEPYPQPCMIFGLVIGKEEFSNRDSRSKNLTYFLNDLQGRPSYKGVDATKVMNELEQKGLISVDYVHDQVIINRIYPGE